MSNNIILFSVISPICGSYPSPTYESIEEIEKSYITGFVFKYVFSEDGETLESIEFVKQLKEFIWEKDKVEFSMKNKHADKCLLVGEDIYSHCFDSTDDSTVFINTTTDLPIISIDKHGYLFVHKDGAKRRAGKFSLGGKDRWVFTNFRNSRNLTSNKAILFDVEFELAKTLITMVQENKL